MVTNKHIGKIVAVIVSIAVVFCLTVTMFPSVFANFVSEEGITFEYESKLFDTSSVIELDILMSDEDWNDMLENAISEEYYQCDVMVNGTRFNNVAIRPKGNTSLSSIVSDSTTDRYSFKIEFDHYVSGQTCFGLDKLILNNNYADATSMKEAVIYDMFAYLDADASLYNYADISVNGETWGVYLALEAVEDSFLLRNYGTSDGNLYKPDSMNMGGAGGMRDMDSDDIGELEQKFFGGTEQEDTQAADDTTSDDTAAQQMPQMGDGATMPEMPQDGSFPQMGDGTTIPEMPQDGSFPQMGDGTTMPEMPQDGSFPQMGDGTEIPEMPDGAQVGHFGGNSGGGGSELNYVDDELDSYSTIWEGEVNSTDDEDHERVVKALKNISSQTDLSAYMDIDNMLKYMAVHTYSVNLDSLSGNMAHNYYLYEQDGMLNMVPWDYNLAFGGMGGMGGGMSGGTGASSSVNFPIDTPFSSGISLEDRQFFAALLENEEYLAQYHEYLRMLCQEYDFTSTYNNIRTQIDDLVNSDPNAFYTYDEYQIACDTLCQFISLRNESISGQLIGVIASTTEGQNADSSTLVDASSINTSDMGTMNMGGGRNMQQSEDWTEGGWSENQADSTFSSQQSPPDGMTAQPDSTETSDAATQLTSSADSSEETQSNKQPKSGRGRKPNDATQGKRTPPNTAANSSDSTVTADENAISFLSGDAASSKKEIVQFASVSSSDALMQFISETSEEIPDAGMMQEPPNGEMPQDGDPGRQAPPSGNGSENGNIMLTPPSSDTGADSQAQIQTNQDAEIQTNEDAQNSESSSSKSRQRPSSERVQFKGFAENVQQSESEFEKINLIWYGVCLGVMMLALIIAKTYKRRKF